ncbi:hypothetical protein AB3N59_18500 [Leptospira sp. WS92.C1]
MGRSLFGIVSLFIAGCFLAEGFVESKFDFYKPFVKIKTQHARTIHQIPNPFAKGITLGDDGKGHGSFFQLDCFSGACLPFHTIPKVGIISGRISLSFCYLSLPPPTAV